MDYVMHLTTDELNSLIQNAVKSSLNELQGKFQPQVIQVNDDEYLSQEQASKFLNASVGSLINWRKSGKLDYKKIGKKVLYSRKALLNLQ